MNKKTTRKKKTKTRTTDVGPVMGKAIALFLEANGWQAGVVGPCEVRVTHAYNNNQRLDDPTGRTLGQYEFVAKFYGRRAPVVQPS